MAALVIMRGGSGDYIAAHLTARDNMQLLAMAINRAMHHKAQLVAIVFGC
ncbi:MAG: hypothetical protein N2483_02650 [Burkholderiaceae bacterium]|nr:hypothetical protein [Burkholderiaceae bacterium]